MSNSIEVGEVGEAGGLEADAAEAEAESGAEADGLSVSNRSAISTSEDMSSKLASLEVNKCN